jgi:CMP-N,N'-diacetyllegionaminic acid synthase
VINDKKVIVVITARAGSKGLPHKNYRPLNGMPLVNHSVLAAQQSQLADLILISSNCPQVKEVVDPLTDERTRFLDRPEELSGSLSKNESALVHAYYAAQFRFSIDATYIVNLQPTSPIRRNGLIDNALNCMDQEQYKSLLTVATHTPLFIRKSASGEFVWYYDPANRPMRQEMREEDFFLHDDGCLYIVQKDILLNEFCRLDKHPCLYVNDKYSSLQIDDELDWKIIENIKKELDETGGYV